MSKPIPVAGILAVLLALAPPVSLGLSVLLGDTEKVFVNAIWRFVMPCMLVAGILAIVALAQRASPASKAFGAAALFVVAASLCGAGIVLINAIGAPPPPREAR